MRIAAAARARGYQPEATNLDVAVKQDGPALFVPMDGPQTRAYESKANIIGYGGAAGGGKSLLEIGLAVTKHRRSIIFRREQDQVRDLWQKLSDMCGLHGRSNENLLIYRDLPGDRYVRLAGVKNPGDWKKFQGQGHDLYCVGAGTPVRMADGTYRPIEQIRVGDMVATLEGPRRVTRTLRMGVRDAVSATVQIGAESFTQIQSANHPVLTTEGWVSHDTLRASRQPESGAATEHRADCICETPLLLTHAGEPRHRATSASGLALLEAQPQSKPGHPDWLVCCADTATRCQGIGYEASADARRDGLPLASMNRTSQGQPQQHCGPVVSESGSHSSSRDADDAPRSTALPGSLGCCSSSPRRGDEHARPYESVARVYPQRLVDAALRSPIGSEDGGQGRTPTHSRRTESWVHPYTREIRQTQVVLEDAALILTPAGRQEVFDLTVDSANHYITGTVGFVNRNCFDEGTEFLEAQVRTLIAWCRTTIPDQPCTVVISFNPPTSPEGEWVIEFFGPWLDVNHPNPAEPGDLRWYATVDGKDVERPDGEPFEHVCGIHDSETIQPLSRTFFPARLEDNPLLEATGYRATLQGLPEPLRSQMLYGDFTLGLQDDAWQVIPTAWVRAAQARWTPEPPKGSTLDQVGADIAQGGIDRTVIVKRYGTWFSEPEVHPGASVPDPKTNADHVERAVLTGGTALIDSDGLGAQTYHLLAPKLASRVVAYRGSSPTKARDRSRVLTFVNVRAAAWWSLRDALDPSSGSTVALPPLRELRVDLCSARYEKLSHGIKIKSKDEIREQLGRSPDIGDSVVMANWTGGYALRGVLAAEMAKPGESEQRDGPKIPDPLLRDRESAPTTYPDDWPQVSTGAPVDGLRTPFGVPL